MIRYRPEPGLPPLAWLASVSHTDGAVVVSHGRFVETRPEFFFEGAWAGDFARGRPDETEVVFGSGAIVDGGDTVFVSSLATTDPLFHARTADAVVVSNSLPLLLAAVGDGLDPAFLGYARVNDSVMDGIDAHDRRIPTRRGAVARLLHHNLRVRRGAALEEPKPPPPPLPSFEAYAACLSDGYAALARNARDARRSRPLKIYSTQSRGYDSTAINSIAAPHGVDGVFTVRTGKGGGAFSDQADEPEVDDDGSEIAGLLGLTGVVPLERRAYREGFADEIYYHASIHEPQDANLKQVADHLRGPALLLTGTLGEMWYTTRLLYAERPEFAKPDLRRTDLSLHGLTETRLRAGFVQAAIPYIGARRRADIVRITDSAELAPWRLGTDYDRPVPRRIAETAGVPRGAFGQRKTGSVVEFTPPQFPQDPGLRRDYERFLVEERLLSRSRLAWLPLVHAFNRMSVFASPRRHRLVYYAWRVASKLAGRDRPPRLLWTGLRGSLHCFAVNRCVGEYRAQLSRAL
jgi:hypothetical protein